MSRSPGDPRTRDPRPDIPVFEKALDGLPDGYSQGVFEGRRWGATVRRSADGRRVWLFAEDLAGQDIVSFNFYRLAADRVALKPCEMSTDKVVSFVHGFEPDADQPPEQAQADARQEPRAMQDVGDRTPDRASPQREELSDEHQ